MKEIDALRQTLSERWDTQEQQQSTVSSSNCDTTLEEVRKEAETTRRQLSDAMTAFQETK